jgi:hypothetical protein
VTAVAAQPGQRDEHLAAVGDDARSTGVGEPEVPDLSCGGAQLVKLVAAGSQQRGRLVGIQRLAGDHAGNGPPGFGSRG